MRARRRVDDRGYAIALSALLLLPMLAFTSLAVDLGSWYARAAQIQRAADAASLAGVASLPSGGGKAAALAVALQNGFDDSDDDITVIAETNVDDPTLNSDQMRVTIRDDRVDQYFTSMFRDDVAVERASVSEYVPPVRMGSPRNFLGTETLPSWVSGLPSGIEEGFWLAISSPCSPAEDGDLLSPERRSRFQFPGSTSYQGCNSGSANPAHDPDGYTYAVTLDENFSAAGPLTIQAFDLPYCAGGAGYHDYNVGSTSASFSVDVTVTEQGAAGTILDTTLDGRSSNGSETSNECREVTSPTSNRWRNGWHNLATISNPTPGATYLIQISSNTAESSQRGPINNFSLRAFTGSSFVACSADPSEGNPQLTTIDSENCPNVHAQEHLSIYVELPSGEPEFFLASIGPEHSGKTMILRLFDPGEGAQLLEILDPLDNPASFSWRVIPRPGAGEPMPQGGWQSAGEVTSMALSGGSNPAQTDSYRWGSQYRYNDRTVEIRIELPDDIAAPSPVGYGGATWWKVRYTVNTAPTDRTTWSIQVLGDPVRLIE